MIVCFRSVMNCQPVQGAPRWSPKGSRGWLRPLWPCKGKQLQIMNKWVFGNGNQGKTATTIPLFIFGLLSILQPCTTYTHPQTYSHTYTHVSCTVHIFVISLIWTSVSQPCPNQPQPDEKPAETVLAKVHLQPTIFIYHPLCCNKDEGSNQVTSKTKLK